MPKSEHQQEKTKQNQKQLAILVECVSACNLKNRIDGYVQVKLGSEKVHKTKTIFRTRNPIWTIRHNNVFILYTTEEKLSEAGGLLFTVMNYNRLVKSEEIGSVQVSKESILGATPNERVEYKLKPADTVGVDQLSKEEKDSNNNSHRRLSTIGHKSFFEIGHNMNVVSIILYLVFSLLTAFCTEFPINLTFFQTLLLFCLMIDQFWSGFEVSSCDRTGQTFHGKPRSREKFEGKDRIKL